MSAKEKRDWRELCEAASKEQNAEELMVLISQLMKALDERNGLANSPLQ